MLNLEELEVVLKGLDDAEKEEEDKEEAEKMLEDYDKNKDGKLTLVEFAASWDEKDEQALKISAIFTTADHDKNGMLDLEEVKSVLKELDHEDDEEREKEKKLDKLIMTKLTNSTS